MDKRLIVASVVVIGLTIFYFKVVKKKTSGSTDNKIEPVSIGGELKSRSGVQSKSTSTVKNTAPSRQSTINSSRSFASVQQVQLATARIPSNQVVRGNNQPTSNSTNATNYCPPGYVWNSVMQSCQKIF